MSSIAKENLPNFFKGVLRNSWTQGRIMHLPSCLCGPYSMVCPLLSLPSINVLIIYRPCARWVFQSPGWSLGGLIIHLQCTISGYLARIPFRCHIFTMWSVYPRLNTPLSFQAINREVRRRRKWPHLLSKMYFICFGNGITTLWQKVSNSYIIHRLTGSEGKEHEKSVIHCLLARSPARSEISWFAMRNWTHLWRTSFVFGVSIRPNKRWQAINSTFDSDNRNARHVGEPNRKPRDWTVLSGSHTWLLWLYTLYTCPFPVVPRNRNREKTSWVRGITIQFVCSSFPLHLIPYYPNQIMSNTFALLQYDGDPLNHRFIDHEGRLAFTM